MKRIIHLVALIWLGTYCCCISITRVGKKIRRRRVCTTGAGITKTEHGLVVDNPTAQRSSARLQVGLMASMIISILQATSMQPQILLLPHGFIHVDLKGLV